MGIATRSIKLRVQTFISRTAPILTLVGLFGLAGVLPAQPAQAVAPSPGINYKINYQGRLLNAAGAVIADGNYNMQFKIYKNGDGLAATDNLCTSLPDCQSTSGTLQWTEEWLNQGGNGVTVKNGYFSVNLGTITTLVGVDLNQPVLWLSTNIAGSPNSTSVSCTPFSSCTPDGEMLPMRRMASAAYAVNAGSANSCITCILQAPTSTAQNTISPITASVVGLTVNATTSTAATALIVNQTQATTDALHVGVTNNAGTVTNGISIDHTGASGTLSNGINISNTSGTVTNGLSFTGTIGTDIFRGATSALTLQGTLGVTITAGTTNAVTVDSAGAGSALLGNTNATTVTVGNTNSTTTSIQGNTAINIGTSSTGGTIKLGGTANTGQIDIGNTANTSAQTVTIGTGGTGVKTITVGGTAANVIAIGNSQTAGSISIGTALTSGATALTLGSLSSTTGTLIQAGTGNINLNVNQAGAGTVVKTVTNNSTSAFQIQNSAGSQVFTTDTTNTLNLVTNGSFEPGFGGWALKTGSAISTVSSPAAFGQKSLLVVTSTSAGSGAKYNLTLSNSTQYTFSLYATVSTGSMNTFDLGYAQDGLTESGSTVCTGKYVDSGGFFRLDCTFTTGTVSGTPYLFIKQSDGVSRNINIDGVMLEQNSSYSDYRDGKLYVSGVVAGPLLIQNDTNSATALEVKAVDRSTVLDVDTKSQRVGVGTSLPAAKLDVLTNDSIALQVNETNTSNQILNLQSNGAAVATISGTGATLLKNSSNSATAFQVQNNSNYEVLTVDTTGSGIVLGKASTLTGKVTFANSAGANLVSIQGGASSAAYALTLPTVAPSTSQCLQSGAVTADLLVFASCGGGGGANVTLSNLTGPTAINTNLTFASGTAHVITAAVPVNAAGDALTLQGGAGAATGSPGSAGGAVTIQGGTGANGTGPSGADGGLVTIAGGIGSTKGSPGGVTIMGGQATVFGNGGDVNIQGGAGAANPAGKVFITGLLVQIGSAATDGAETDLQLDALNTFTDANTCDTTNTEGALYYNTATNAIRGCVNGGWQDVVTTDGLGLIAFGVVPNSGSTGPGDLATITDTTNRKAGPCKVFANTTTQVGWNSCIAYSSGRKMVIAAGTQNTTNAGAGNFQHLCMWSAGAASTTPTLQTAGAEGAGLPTFSTTAPVLCLADIKFAAANTTITDIYDTRTFTDTVKEFASAITTTPVVGQMVKAVAVTPGAVTATTIVNDAKIEGVIVATSGATSTTTVNAIVAVSGPAFVKAITGSNAIADYINGSGTAGYATTIAIDGAAIYSTLGTAKTVWTGATACAAGKDACEGSVYTLIRLR